MVVSSMAAFVGGWHYSETIYAIASKQPGLRTVGSPPIIAMPSHLIGHVSNFNVGTDVMHCQSFALPKNRLRNSPPDSQA